MFDQNEMKPDANLGQKVKEKDVKSTCGDTIEASCAEAEGYSTHASGGASHAEGQGTTASGLSAHAEGEITRAEGQASHAEGRDTRALGFTSHAEGRDTRALGFTSHAEGEGTRAEDIRAHAEGGHTRAYKESAHAEGYKTYAYGIASHAEGGSTTTGGTAAHAEGSVTTANSDFSHAEGYKTYASGAASHAEGEETTVIGSGSHAEGGRTTVKGRNSHAEGYKSTVEKDAAHAEGFVTVASGHFSHSEGHMTTASGDISHAEGNQTNTAGQPGAHIMGRYGDATNAFSWHLANGTNFSTNRSLAAKILSDGRGIADSGWVMGSADYAEMFETVDGQPIEVGYFVTLKGEKIRKAKGIDGYILGITSADPAVLSDSRELRWKDKYVTDEWDRVQYHDVVIPAEMDQDGNVIIPECIEKQPILNPAWDYTREYIPRSERQEWVAVGLLGKLRVRDDGTCQVDDFCRPNDEGIATASDNGYRVMERTGPNQILVLFR